MGIFIVVISAIVVLAILLAAIGGALIDLNGRPYDHIDSSTGPDVSFDPNQVAYITKEERDRALAFMNRPISSPDTETACICPATLERCPEDEPDCETCPRNLGVGA